MEKWTEFQTYEMTRFDSVPTWAKAILLVLNLFGLIFAVFFTFGFVFRGMVLENYAYYYILVGLYSAYTFLVLPAVKKDKKGLPWYDVVFAVLSLSICLYFCLNSWEITQVGWYQPTAFNFALALVLSVLILEGGRRIAGKVYIAVCIVLGLYPVFAGHMPGPLYGLEFSFSNTIGYHIFSGSGLLGLPAKVVGDILIGYLLFAAMMIASGAGQFFLKVALCLFGRFRGGPAKVAVVSSGFFGSLSGAVFGNILVTGSVTIPAMKRLGYPPHYAGAIESCASVGGVFMPPVMGTTAFIMAAFLGIPYSTIVVAAIIPAILYYFGLLMQVDGYAARAGIKRLPKEEIPSFRKTILEGWPFLLVLVFLVWGLLYMRWEYLTPYYATALMALLSFFKKKTWLTPKRIVKILTMIGNLIATVVSVIFPVSFIICGLLVTGTTASLTSTVIGLGQENLFLILALGVLACYVMGMAGLISPAYIFLAVSFAPAVLEVGGLDVLATHMFIIYYVMVAGLTPPVAVAAFVGAAIAEASPLRTAVQAMRLGIVIYFVPFFFLFNPSLILRGAPFEALYLFSFCLIGIFFISAGIEGYLLKIGGLSWWERPPLIVAGFLIGFPQWSTTYTGAALAFIVIAVMVIKRRMQVALKGA